LNQFKNILSEKFKANISKQIISKLAKIQFLGLLQLRKIQFLLRLLQQRKIQFLRSLKQRKIHFLKI